MIAVGNNDKKYIYKDRWNYYHHMLMLLLLVENHRLPLFYMSKRFIWLNETKQYINLFTIGYIINPSLDVNKTFKEQVEKCMYNIFG